MLCEHTAVLQNCCFIAEIAIFYRIIFDHINKFGTLPTVSVIGTMREAFCIRDAEVTGSNPVPPNDVNTVSRKI